MKNQKLPVHIAMICDDNYVMPTCVAITSIIEYKETGRDLIVHIISSELSETTKEQFSKFNSDGVNIDIISVNANIFDGMHIFEEGSICVASISALFKFMLPEILPGLDKVLYLDGDLIVRESISFMYDDEPGDNYCCAVSDSGQIYFKKPIFSELSNKYINSGVLLLNLKKMREDDISNKLIETKKNKTDASSMDQDAFNIVFDKHIKYWPIRNNFMPVSLDRADARWTVTQINELFDTDYSEKAELYKDAAIIHYSSKDKPWKTFDGACADLWYDMYMKAPISHPLMEVFDISKLPSPCISVIMPCYNVENYVEMALNSVFNQSFQNFEIICLNDGSTDNTLNILTDISNHHENMTVINNPNMHQGYERNIGIENAKGKYIYFMDSDDEIDASCFETCISFLEKNKLDLIYFEGTTKFESEDLAETHSSYINYYHRKNAYTKTYKGTDLFYKLRMNNDYIISPCMQMAKREFIIKNDLKFPELPSLEDNLYTLETCLAAERVKVIPNVFYYRYIRNNSTMTRNDKVLQNYYSYLYTLTKATEISATPDYRDIATALRKNNDIYLSIIRKLRINNSEKITIVGDSEEALNIPESINSEINLKSVSALFMYFDNIIEELNEKFKKSSEERTKLNDKLQNTIAEKSEINRKLKTAWTEKTEINRKLQTAWDEKSELNRKLNKTYEEKSELNRKLQQTYEEKSELNRKLQQTYKEKAERGIEIKNLKNSKSYRIGRIITWIPRKLKKFFIH